MKKLLLCMALFGLVVSTSVMAGKPEPAACPCDFTETYVGTTSACELTLNLEKGQETSLVMTWSEDDGQTDYLAGVIRGRGSYGCVTSKNDDFFPEEDLTRKEFAACAEELEAIFEAAPEDELEPCPPPPTCPCWEESELQSIDDLDTDLSCSGHTYAYAFPNFANISNSTQILAFGAQTDEFAGVNSCNTSVNDETLNVSKEEAQTCIAQIAAHRDALGSPFPRPPKRVFVSSMNFTGDLVTEAADLALGDFSGDGLEAGDALCTHLADEAGLGGSWTFWGSTTSVNARDRIDPSAPFFRTDGITKVADDLADILDCTDSSCLDTSIELDELLVTKISYVMTGTAEDGTAFSGGIRTCNNWTSSLERYAAPECSLDDSPCRVTLGVSDRTAFNWTQAGAQHSCHEARPIYCFEN